jgi:polyferredoxin
MKSTSYTNELFGNFNKTIQAVFFLLCGWIGIEFYYFAKWGSTGGQSSFIPRSPGVEGFLPISSLISFKYWIQTGIINDIHPSGLFIFIAIIATSLLLKKAFCSWLCPIGTLSEALWMFGEKLFGKNLTIPKWLDYPLRSLKYILLLFFVWSIWQMDVPSLKAFIYSPYNKVADIKMFMFFANISMFALWTVIILMTLSVFIKNFWCRFLCPYGALLGALSWMSPLKITRNKSTCVNCELCTKVCLSNIKVHNARQVLSDECTSCLECVQICPVKNTLNIRTSISDTRVHNWLFGTLVVAVFVAITGLAMLTGHWQNNISKEEYLKRFQQIESPIYQHFRGRVPEYSTND